MTLVFTGQILLRTDLRLTASGRRALARARDLLDLSESDFILGELEASVLCARDQGEQKPRRRGIFLHTAPLGVLDCLWSLGIRLVAIANNHTGDLGPEGLICLRKEMRLRGMIGAGGAGNLAEAAAPQFYDTPTGRVGVIAVASKVPVGYAAGEHTPGVFHLTLLDSGKTSERLDPSEVHLLLASIAAARHQSSSVVVCHHNHYWGKRAVNHTQSTAEGPGIPAWRKGLARMCLDAGADVYVGHGEPRLQGIEIYGDRPIFYCLGSFMFQTRTAPGFYGPEVWESVVAKVIPTFGACSLSVVLEPVLLNEVGDTVDTHDATRGLPRRCTLRHALRILNRLAKLSEPMGTAIDIRRNDEGRIIGLVHSTSQCRPAARLDH